MKSIFYRVLFIFLAIINLQGCVNAAMTGIQAVYNHHSIQKNLNDQYITMKAYHLLHDYDQLKEANISIATYNGEVLLTGQAPKNHQKTQAEHLVSTIHDVKIIHNSISIAAPSSTLTRISDTWLTTKVKAKLLTSGDVDVTKVKVVTENSTVYLMGIITPEEAEVAVDLAKNTDGVAKVMNYFSYLRITRS